MAIDDLDEARKSRERIEQMRKKEAEELAKGNRDHHKRGFSNPETRKKAAENKGKKKWGRRNESA